MNLEYFSVTLQIVSGVLCPVAIIWLLTILKDSVSEWHASNGYKRETFDLMASCNWVFVGQTQPPNKDYTTLTFRHIRTDNKLSIGVERSKLYSSTDRKPE